jgi:hypothetical protein
MNARKQTSPYYDMLGHNTYTCHVAIFLVIVVVLKYFISPVSTTILDKGKGIPFVSCALQNPST